MTTTIQSALKGTSLSQWREGDGNQMKAMHDDMQKMRKSRKEVTLKSYLAATWDAEMTPQKFYQELGIELSGMTVEKMLNTSELTKWLFPELFRDAIRRGLEYTPFYTDLIATEETIGSTGITMPFMDWTTIDRDEVRLRDTNEGATITEGEIIVWSEKQVSIKKKARGLKQTYESIMFTPIDLAAIFFEELGTQLGSDLDAELIDVALNGDQADGSEAAPVIGVTTANTLTYADLTRAWIRFRRIGRNSTALLVNETDAITILNMAEFQRTIPAGAVQASPVTLNIVSPLPTSQDVYVHDSVSAKKIIMIDRARAFVQLTAMPLLIESERIVSRQIEGEYVSIITGFANIFKDGRMVIDYSTTLGTNPGPTPASTL
jgi:hypothetical protein